MRVLHVAESIKGGCGTYLNELVPVQLRAWGADAVRVVAPDAHVDMLAAIPRGAIDTFARGGRSAAALGGLAGAIRAGVGDFQPDVVHLHSTFAGLVGRPLLRLARPRPAVIYCAHGWAFDMARSGWKLSAIAAVERVLAPLADRIVAISDYERRRGLDIGIGPGRIVTVLNGLAEAPVPPPALAAPDGRLRLLFVGRLDAQKGWDLLVDAVEGLSDRVSVRMIGASVVGDAAAARPLPAHVAALGWRTPAEIAGELATCDLVVVPSRWEGFGLVAVEAMRAGRAVLAADAGGLPEVVADGVTGRLVPPGDAAALRAAILRFDAATIAMMGSAGRRRFLDHFTIGRTADSLAEIYTGVLEC